MTNDFGDTSNMPDGETIDLEAPVIIGCPAHGDFAVIAGQHLDGIGCPHCDQELISGQASEIASLKEIRTNLESYSDRKEFAIEQYKEASIKLNNTLDEYRALVKQLTALGNK